MLSNGFTCCQSGLHVVKGVYMMSKGFTCCQGDLHVVKSTFGAHSSSSLDAFFVISYV